MARDERERKLVYFLVETQFVALVFGDERAFYFGEMKESSSLHCTFSSLLIYSPFSYYLQSKTFKIHGKMVRGGFL
jgi:hypothetical protein